MNNWEYSDSNEEMDSIISSVLNHYKGNFGKQTRSKLMFSVAKQTSNQFGQIDEESKALLAVASDAIETLHLGSLIHDDILDEAELEEAFKA